MAAFRGGFAALSVVAMGCGGSGPVTHEVSGVVTLDGAPLPEVAVVFTPDGSVAGANVQSTALTDAEGRYELLYKVPSKTSNTPLKGKGAVQGTHAVTVTDYKMMAEHLPRPGRVPLPYTQASTTPLRFEVGADTPEIPITLTR